MFGRQSSPGFKYRPRLKVWTDGKNNEFNPETFAAVSYGWWTYVAKFKGVVVFNDYKYSSTTSSHQSSMKILLDTLKVKDVVFVSQSESLSKGVCLDSIYQSLILAEIRLKAKGRSAKFYQSQNDIIKRSKANIARLKPLGAKLSGGTVPALKASLIKREALRLEAARTEARASRARRVAVVVEHKQSFESLDSVSI